MSNRGRCTYCENEATERVVETIGVVPVGSPQPTCSDHAEVLGR